MIRLTCVCGSMVFHADKRNNILRCVQCWKRFHWNGKEWIIAEKRGTARAIVSAIFAAEERVFEWVDAKLVHPKREKKTVPIKQVRYTIRVDNSKRAVAMRKKVLRFWDKEIDELAEKGRIEFLNNQHKGKLRGKNIAKAMHSMLGKMRVLPFETRLRFEHDKAILEAVSNERMPNGLGAVSNEQ